MRWSPNHPGVLASVDAAGFLQIWSLGSSSEAPLEELLVTGISTDTTDQSDSVVQDGKACVASSLNCVGWAADSRFIACGMPLVSLVLAREEAQ